MSEKQIFMSEKQIFIVCFIYILHLFSLIIIIKTSKKWLGKMMWKSYDFSQRYIKNH